MAGEQVVVDAAITGERRAFQYLRLVDLGRRDEAAALLEPLDDRDMIAVGAGFMRIGRSFAGKLPDRSRRRAAMRRQEKLAGRTRAYLSGSDGARSLAVASGAEALRVIAAMWPDQPQRQHFLETMGRATFDAGEADSAVRRRYFGGTPTG